MHATTSTALLVAIFSIATSAYSAGAGALKPLNPSTPAWRCGNTYSDQPCDGGRAVEVNDSRSAGDQRAQDVHTRGTQRQADAMARERRSVEAQAAKQRAAIIAPPPQPAAEAPQRETVASQPRTRKPKRHAKGESDAFTASGPSSPAAERKKKRRGRE